MVVVIGLKVATGRGSGSGGGRGGGDCGGGGGGGGGQLEIKARYSAIIRWLTATAHSPAAEHDLILPQFLGNCTLNPNPSP